MSETPMFPFGVQPFGPDPHGGERGPDTMNRLLLHGARHHHRKAVFVSADGGETPDWRADRLSIRLALALRQVFGVGPGDVVALWMPLSVSWALTERAVWGLGAASLPIPIELDPASVSRLVSSVRAKMLFASTPAELDISVVTVGGDLPDLLEQGGVLDTPERASGFRASARETPPFAVASLEREGREERTHASWVSEVEAFLRRFPPETFGRRRLDPSQSNLASRIALHAGWADGLSTVVLAAEGNGGAHGYAL